MGNRVLIFVSDKTDVGQLYNPDEYPLYRKDVASNFSAQAGAREGELILIEYVSGNTWKIIRRIKWPYSANQYNWLVTDQIGGGNNPNPKEDKPMQLGSDDQAQFGLGLGLGPDPKKKNWLIWVILGFLAYETIKK